MFSLLFVAFLLGAQIASAAAELSLKYSPPCLLQNQFGNCDGGQTNVFASYIKRIYQFGLGIAGVLAVGMIVAGAIRRVVSAGNPSGITESNSMITSALWGLALLFGSYLILRTINPQLVSLRDPNAPTVTSTSPFAYQSTTSTCPVPSHTSCFFDPARMATGASSTAYCDPESNDICTAINLTTGPCNPSKPRGVDENGRARPTTPCECENCKPLNTERFPATPGLCDREFNFLTKRQAYCFLKSGFLDDLLVAFPYGGIGRIQFGTGSGKWRIGEAFPPKYLHQTPGHYNGSVIDFGIEGGLSSVEKCEDAMTLARRLAARPGITEVLIEGRESAIPAGCETIFQETMNSNNKIRRLKVRDFHLHIESSY